MSLVIGHLLAVKDWKMLALIVYALVGTTGALVIHTALGSPYRHSVPWSFMLVTPLLGVCACAIAVLCDAVIAALYPRRLQPTQWTAVSSHYEEQAAADACHAARQADV
jgi:MFS family permease